MQKSFFCASLARRWRFTARWRSSLGTDSPSHSRQVSPRQGLVCPQTGSCQPVPLMALANLLAGVCWKVAAPSLQTEQMRTLNDVSCLRLCFSAASLTSVLVLFLYFCVDVFHSGWSSDNVRPSCARYRRSRRRPPSFLPPNDCLLFPKITRLVGSRGSCR